MNISTGLTEGIREIFSHKFRSFLTMFGVILGVASLLSMFGLTAGAIAGSKEVLNGIGGLEKVGIIDAPIPPSQEGMQELSPGRTYRDVTALRENTTLLSYISPEVVLGGAKVVASNKQCNPRVSGVEPDMFYVDKHAMAYGRFLNPIDIELSKRVCVLGDNVVNQLYDYTNEALIGKTVLINSEAFTVIGILTPYISQQKGAAPSSNRRGPRSGGRWDPFWPKNNLVAIPITTMQLVFKSSRVDNGVEQGPDPKLNDLNVQISDLDRFHEALDQIRNILLLTHNGIQDFGLSTREDYFDSIEGFNQSMKITGSVIAGISLLVGGLGIANTMLASISERVREIGIRRAIGARQIDIFVQILIESIVLALIGGVLGIGLGYALSNAIVIFAPNQNSPIIETQAVVISFSFALGVGFFAGLYPAWHASRLSPLQALRYE
ncbi:MAG: ABC transporter permease [Verrucomicrobiota bacterium]